jgi:NAD(P)-dependent dehydrogenase (short-subunit alcohol dehydrogenase family)
MAEGSSDKVAVVTGGSKGIGAAAAQALGSEGMKVVIVDVDREAGQKSAAAIAEGGTEAQFVEADVSRSEAARRAAEEAVSSFGRIDVLVNSAGIQRYGDVVETPEEVWDEVLGVNLKAMFLMAKHCVPHMTAAGGGAIVNVSSVQAFAAQRGVAAYAASKGGVIALTRAMAVDHAPAIRVNCVCPGSVDTPMLRDAAAKFFEVPEDAIAQWGSMHPLGRVAKPEEVAALISFLASPKASFITGASILVDGGLLSVIGGT